MDSAGSTSTVGDLIVERYNAGRERQRRISRPLMRYGFSNLVAHALLSAAEMAREEVDPMKRL